MMISESVEVLRMDGLSINVYPSNKETLQSLPVGSAAGFEIWLTVNGYLTSFSSLMMLGAPPSLSIHQST